MRLYVGIDLGSTTTKAVVLDEGGRPLGRGITNSRSDYDVACAVARREALDDARLTLARRALAGAGLPPPAQEALIARLEGAFRLAQHVAQLDRLEAQLHAELPAVERLFPGARLAPAFDELLAAMRDDAPALFRAGAQGRATFFRDAAGSQWARRAEAMSDGRERPYEALLGAFDKAILKVEGAVVDLELTQVVEDAVGAAIEQGELETGRAAAVTDALAEGAGAALEVAAAVGTGYGRARLPFPKERIRSEILCHGLGAHVLFPGTRTVLDIGGQDTKAIQVDDQGIVTGFQMNDRCAAGCGRYLGYIADEMNLGLHELGPLALEARRSVRISSTCTVFAGAELRERLALGQRREDILAGLHRAIILRAMSLLARSGGVKDELTFTGGVANNPAAVAALRQLVEEGYGKVTMNISPDSIYTGALGAAHFALRDALVAA
ncbi:MAG: acyl-CoA dehydratase activase [Planctomycetes bacterium]|nr:acyl-CoA dehydratase activase [Planctomycetota bacterium]